MSGDAAPEVLGFEPDAQKRRRRANPWEIALWTIGVVLLGGSGVLVYYFVILIFGNAQGQTPSDLGVLSAFVQASSIYTPGLVTGGVVCVALAIFARATNLNATRRHSERHAQAEAPPDVTSAATEPTEITATEVTHRPSVSEEGPPERSRAAARPDEPAEPDDYSAFMRPTDG